MTTSLPKGFLQLVSPLLGGELPDFLQALDQPAVHSLRISSRRSLTDSPDILHCIQTLDAIPWQEGAYYFDPSQRLGAHPLHFAGAYYIQEASAMAAVAALNPQPGERVLDLCAAPGGKSSQIADRLSGEGVLIANEPVPGRARELSFNLERMGVKNAVVLNEDPRRLEQVFTGFFDRVLVDAPCSGEGMFRKEPGSRQQWTSDSPALCAKRQLLILKSAEKMLRPGGVLVYSTCTFNALENEGVVQEFLSQHPDYQLQPFALQGGLAAANGMLRLWPHQIRGEGHFVAKLLLTTRGERPIPKPDRPQKQPQDAQLDAVKAAADAAVQLIASPNAWLGQTAVCRPEGLPDLSALRVLRLGLHIGQMQKGVFRPDHALALAENPRQTLPLTLQQAETYRKGEVLPCDASLSSWLAPTVQGWPLGWGKAVKGQLKNHYPKGLRKA